MVDTPLNPDEASPELTKRFLLLSGYTAADILGSSESRRSFVTHQGGKYVVSKSGKSLRKILGPNTPKQMRAAEVAEEDN